MSPRLPVINSRELIAVLEKAGFEIKRQTGSHVILYKVSLRRPVSVPQHSGDLPSGTVRVIIREAGLTVEEFLNLLNR